MRAQRIAVMQLMESNICLHFALSHFYTEVLEWHSALGLVGTVYCELTINNHLGADRGSQWATICLEQLARERGGEGW